MRNRVDGLDGLRAIAVFVVVGAHTTAYLHGGFAGVTIFFVLSGYLITSILASEFETTNRINLRNFYIRRFLRLMPALWVMIVVYAILAELSGGPWKHGRLADILPALFYYMDWFRAFEHGSGGWLGHTWSLAVEEQFYIFFPLVLFGLLRAFPKKMVGASLLSLTIIAFVWRVHLIRSGASENRIYNGFDTNLESLLWGSVLAIPPAMRLNYLIPAACGIVATLGLLVIIFFPISVGSSFQLFWRCTEVTLVSIFAFCVIASVLTLAKAKRFNPLNNPLLVSLGKISYGIYLWHYPISQRLGMQRSSFLLTSVVATALAATSYHFIELPILRLKTRYAAAQHGADDQSHCTSTLNQAEVISLDQ